MDKLNGIKPGDRVRVTVEGYVYAGLLAEAGPVSFRVGFGEGRSLLVTSEEARDGVMEVERIEKPLAVGDRVRGVTSGDTGEIIWMDDTYVVTVGAPHHPPLVKHLANVERIS